jgi:hypothetical protein
MRVRRQLVGAATLVACALAGESALAQNTPKRDQTWQTVSTLTLATGAGLQLLMPRVGYFETDTSLGWKPRWHASVLAPVMTLAVVGMANEMALKDGIKGYRPGCDETNEGVAGCESYGAPSTHAFGAAAALGHGTAVFLIDSLKWNGGRFNAPAFIGDVALPLVLGVVTLAGRSAGNYESGGQIVAGATLGLGFGLASGAVYGLMRSPGCGYSQGVICW